MVRGQPGGTVVRPNVAARTAGAQAQAVVQGQGVPDIRGHAGLLPAAFVAKLAEKRTRANRREAELVAGVRGNGSLSEGGRSPKGANRGRRPASPRSSCAPFTAANSR